MKVMSLQQFVQQAREPQQDNGAYKIGASIRELVDGLETFEDDRRVEVTIGYPENDSICVRFLGHDFTSFGD